MSTEPSNTTPAAAWAGVLDDACLLPPRETGVHEATAAHARYRQGQYGDLVGSLVVPDQRLPLIRGFTHPLTVVITGGAGQVAGPAGLAARLGLQLAAIQIALRDLDDLAQNARRVVAAVQAARDEGVLGEEPQVYVEIPSPVASGGPSAGWPSTGWPSTGWLRAADEVAAAELRLLLRTTGTEERELAAWIEAALDRETPFACTGLVRAVRHAGDEGGAGDEHGFLNVLLATRHAFDGAGIEDVTAMLADRSTESLLLAAREAGEVGMAGARRWFTSFGAGSIEETVADLRSLGLL